MTDGYGRNTRCVCVEHKLSVFINNSITFLSAFRPAPVLLLSTVFARLPSQSRNIRQEYLQGTQDAFPSLPVLPATASVCAPSPPQIGVHASKSPTNMHPASYEFGRASCTVV